MIVESTYGFIAHMLQPGIALQSIVTELSLNSYIRRVIQPTIVVIKNSTSGKTVSLQSSLLAQGDMGMRKPHSLLAMYASAERGRPATMISVEE